MSVNLDHLENVVANHTLVTMINKSDFFSICTIDKVLRNMGIQAQCGRSYDILDTLHCVNYKDMPDEIRRSIPDLIKNVIGEPEEVIESQPEPQPNKRGMVRLSFFK